MTARDLARVAVFAALIAALGLLPAVKVFPDMVPITAQTLGVMLAGAVLGGRLGALAVLTFLALLAVGLPLLAGGRGGLGVFVSPSAGYLVGFVIGAWVIGRLVELRPPGFTFGWLLMAILVGGIAVVYAFGIPVNAWQAGSPLWPVLVKSAVFLPGDLVKAVIAASVSWGVTRGYPSALPARRRDRATAEGLR